MAALGLSSVHGRTNRALLLLVLLSLRGVSRLVREADSSRHKGSARADLRPFVTLWSIHTIHC